MKVRRHAPDIQLPYASEQRFKIVWGARWRSGRSGAVRSSPLSRLRSLRFDSPWESCCTHLKRSLSQWREAAC